MLSSEVRNTTCKAQFRSKLHAKVLSICICSRRSDTAEQPFLLFLNRLSNPYAVACDRCAVARRMNPRVEFRIICVYNPYPCSPPPLPLTASFQRHKTQPICFEELANQQLLGILEIKPTHSIFKNKICPRE